MEVEKIVTVEVEVETLRECEAALDENPDVIMLDNMSPAGIKEAVKMREDKGLKEKVLFEVSGGINIDNVREYTDTGVDIISSGALTASIHPVDFSLEIVMREA